MAVDSETYMAVAAERDRLRERVAELENAVRRVVCYRKPGNLCAPYPSIERLAEVLNAPTDTTGGEG